MEPKLSSRDFQSSFRKQRTRKKGKTPFAPDSTMLIKPDGYLTRVCFDCFLAKSLKNNLIEKDKRGSAREKSGLVRGKFPSYVAFPDFT